MQQAYEYAMDTAAEYEPGAGSSTSPNGILPTLSAL